MEFNIELHISKNLNPAEEYFITFLNNRFEYLNKLWTQTLEKHFSKKFKPISIFYNKNNTSIPKENYIIISPKLNKTKKSNFIKIPENEDVNKLFSESKLLQTTINKIADKQGRIFILTWTNSFLNIPHPKVTIIGPNPKIVTHLDNKIEHIKLFTELDLPRNNVRVHNSIEEIKRLEKFPFFISAAYSSGGHESALIYTERELDRFYVSLREENKWNKFLVADILENIISSPNINAVVLGENNTKIICISEQILKGNHYLGNIYPWIIDEAFSENAKHTLISVTKTVGNYLAKQGFRGMFGLDFIIDNQGNVFTVDLNPRHQGGYLCNVLMSTKINLLEIELKLSLNEVVPDFQESDLQPDFCWGHTKLKGCSEVNQIIKSFTKGTPIDPFNDIGKQFCSVFYPKNTTFDGNTAGYYITSDKEYDKLLEKIKRVDILIGDIYV
jgi:predicted ATP-grasp superfamily ATP-dependent carboligase